ncbi:MAG: DUF6173 family protein [Synergistaceae bacterium]|jgi:hypothetical protein|nr:DUF6173 family protein [Synergistaceae bacterium]
MDADKLQSPQKAIRNFNLADATPFLGDILPETTKHRGNSAEWAYERLASLFKDFEDDLDDEHEIGLQLVSFGNANVYHISDIGYWGPDIIIFHCRTQEGHAADLIQHVSQLNVLLLALPKLEEKARRIGFFVGEEKPD